MVRVLKAIELLSVSIFSIDLPPSKKNKLGNLTEVIDDFRDAMFTGKTPF